MADELHDLVDKALLRAQQRIQDLKDELRNIEPMADDSEMSTRIRLNMEQCKKEIAADEELIMKNISLADLSL